MLSLGKEPLAIIATAVAALNAVQAAAIPMPNPIHYAVVVVTVVGGVILARAQVTPTQTVNKLIARLSPPTASGAVGSGAVLPPR